MAARRSAVCEPTTPFVIVSVPPIAPYALRQPTIPCSDKAGSTCRLIGSPLQKPLRNTQSVTTKGLRKLLRSNSGILFRGRDENRPHRLVVW